MSKLPEERPVMPSQRMTGGGMGKAALVAWWLVVLVALIRFLR